ncbi:MAG TPA: hypothetical protein G4O04_00195 [Anaerolineae bacterium]|nr:hypothetical protein [Anaerolineae bacterium]HID84092.1 hypothetical protein [Anaerolineales bacterium]HIQ08496.1 hypothetical protein [Anaerolineaceae bacterium]
MPPANRLFAVHGVVANGASTSKYVLVSNGVTADLVPADQVPSEVLASLADLGLDRGDALQRIERARAWMYYMENFHLGGVHPPPDGSKQEELKIDMKCFLGLRRERLDILNPYVTALQVYFMTHQADRYRDMWRQASPGSEPGRSQEGTGFWFGGDYRSVKLVGFCRAPAAGAG